MSLYASRVPSRTLGDPNKRGSGGSRTAARRLRRAGVSLILGLLAWAAVAAAAAPAGLAAGAVHYARLENACPAPQPGRATCFAIARRPVAAASASSAGVEPYVVKPGFSRGPAEGYTPGDLASAYGYTATVGGAGQTIAIVDAYDDPNIEENLKTFDEHYGLGECTTADGCFKKVNQEGNEAPLRKRTRPGGRRRYPSMWTPRAPSAANVTSCSSRPKARPTKTSRRPSMRR